MSVATPSAGPRLASRPTPAGPSRPVAARPVAARSTAPRPAPRPHPGSTSATSVKSAVSTSGGRVPAPSVPPVGAIASAPAGGGKDTSSSAGKVFAKPSKEWVLPERAKPGRKVSVEEPDSKRQSQNRLSQRAHRARRTDYIATLEERIRQFENDEIHSNVRLQEVARALKADNERLKDEVTTLQTSLSATASRRGSPVPKGWEEERGMLLNEVRTLRHEVATLRSRVGVSPGGMMDGNVNGVIDMRSLMGTGTPMGRTPTAMINGSDPDARRDLSCPICPNPDPDCPCQQTHLGLSTHSLPHCHPHPHPHSLTSHRAHLPDPSIPLGSAVLSPQMESVHSCGFCSTSDECLCRAVQVDEDEDVKPDISILTPPTASIRLEESCGLCADGGFCACAVARGSPSVSTTTTSEGRAPWSTSATSGVFAATVSSTAPPATSGGAVPLRKLGKAGQGVNGVKKSVWTLDSGIATAATPIAPLTKAEAQCKEFCENFFTDDDPVPIAGPSNAPIPLRAGAALSASANTTTQNRFWKSSSHKSLAQNGDIDEAEEEDDYPDNTNNGPLLMSCCGNAGLCNHSMGGCAGEVIGIGGLIPGMTEQQAEKETIRVDQAWKALKAHPNAKFASLAFLADVVAQRAPAVSSTSRASTPTYSQAASPGRPANRRVYTTPAQGQSHVQEQGHRLGGQGISAGISSLGLSSPSASPAPTDLRGRAGESMMGGPKGLKRKVVETSALRDALHLLDAVKAGSEHEARAAQEDIDMVGGSRSKRARLD